MIFRGLPGFRDFPPEELALRTHIFRVWRDVASRYGFEEYDGPPLESLDLYTGKSGDEIVGQLYNFRDKGDRDVALRPEMTPTLARMVGAHGSARKKPIRWFSIPQLFRYERQQRGRLREHFQLNCDVIGEPGPLADAEIIALAIDVMRGFGLGPGDVRVRISDRRLLNALMASCGVTGAHLLAAYTALDKLERMGTDAAKAELLTAGLSSHAIERVLETAQMKREDQLRSAMKTSAEQVEPFFTTLRSLGEMGFGEWGEIDLTIVRGLAYYTGTVFELFDAKGELRAICGGGRYDSLLASVGGAELPAVGFGMGDVVLGELLTDRGLHPGAPASIDVFVASVTDDDRADVLRLAHELRDAGVRVEYAFNASAVGKQLTLANARGARLAVVIGPDDRARNEAQLKDLAAKTQESVPRADLVSRLSSLISRLPASHG